MTLWVPATFWDDYGERFPDDGTQAVEVRRAGNRVLISGTAEHIEKLRSNADYYCEFYGPDYGPDACPASIKRSAAATIRAIDRARI